MWSKPVQMCQTPSFRYVENCAHGPDVSPPTILCGESALNTTLRL
jgi:hypothetical protein